LSVKTDRYGSYNPGAPLGREEYQEERGKLGRK